MSGLMDVSSMVTPPPPPTPEWHFLSLIAPPPPSPPPRVGGSVFENLFPIKTEGDDYPPHCQPVNLVLP